MAALFGFTKVSGHRNLGARSLLPGLYPTDDSLSGRVSHEGMLPMRI